MKNRPMYRWIPVDYAPMQDLLVDIKTMSQAFGGYQLLLVITCNQTNFTIAVPLRDRQTQTIAEALIYRVIYLFGPPRQIVCDKFIDTALDKTHYRLKDTTGLLLDGTYHVNRIKKGSACTLQGIVDTFDSYQKALKNTLLNKLVIETPDNKIQEVTLKDGSKELNYLPGTIMDYTSIDS